MTEEIKLIAEIRHLKRNIDAAIIPMFLVAGVLFCAALDAGSKSKQGVSLTYAGGSIATLLGGQMYLGKMEKRKREISRRLSQLQRERS